MPETMGEVVPKPAAAPAPAVAAPGATGTPLIRCFTWRNSHHKFRTEFARDFAKCFAREIINATQSESDGNISVVVFYR